MARKPKREMVNGSELARRLGVSRSAVAKAKREGRISPDAAGLYDLVATTEAFLGSRSRSPSPAPRGGGNRSPRARDDASSSAGPDASPAPRAPRVQADDKKRADWAMLKEREQFLKLRLERRELQRSLVRRSVVEHEFSELGVLIRDRFRALGKRLRDRLAAEVNAKRVGEIIEAEVDAILSELAASRRQG
jgi:hypothetical protein